jgi:hypothetical protein
MPPAVAVLELALMIVAKAVAGVPPTCGERLDGSTAAKSWIELDNGRKRAILLPASSANQNAPSGPTVSPPGPLLAVGTGNSLIVKLAVTLAILLPANSLNQRLSSGPGNKETS